MTERRTTARRRDAQFRYYQNYERRKGPREGAAHETDFISLRHRPKQVVSQAFLGATQNGWSAMSVTEFPPGPNVS